LHDPGTATAPTRAEVHDERLAAKPVTRSPQPVCSALHQATTARRLRDLPSQRRLSLSSPNRPKMKGG